MYRQAFPLVPSYTHYLLYTNTFSSLQAPPTFLYSNTYTPTLPPCFLFLIFLVLFFLSLMISIKVFNFHLYLGNKKKGGCKTLTNTFFLFVVFNQCFCIQPFFYSLYVGVYNHTCVCILNTCFLRVCVCVYLVIRLVSITDPTMCMKYNTVSVRPNKTAC